MSAFTAASTSVLVEIGDLGGHGVEVAGLLTHGVVLTELCRRYGFCTHLQDTDLAGAASAEEVIDIVVRAEGLDPVMWDSKMRREMVAIADDWLFAPHGRGTTSGKPW